MFSYFGYRGLRPEESSSDSDDSDNGPERDSDGTQAPSSKSDALNAILERDDMDIDTGAEQQQKIVTVAEDVHLPGMCAECEDQPFSVLCDACGDNFCIVCFQSLHKKGKRRTHVLKPIENTHYPKEAAAQHSQIASHGQAKPAADAPAPVASETPQQSQQADAMSVSASSSQQAVVDENGEPVSPKRTKLVEGYDSDDDANPTASSSSTDITGAAASSAATVSSSLQAPRLEDKTLTESGAWFSERALYIPLRLTYDERKSLRLVQAALNVSEYTDKVDIVTWGSKTKRMAAQLKEICAILSGLVVASDYNKGQQLLKDKDFSQNAKFFQSVFEIGRRYKVMNPEKMRSEYGKLVYMLQDSVTPHVKELLQFSCVRKIRTVFETLREGGAVDMLNHPLMEAATKDIDSGEGKSRYDVQRESKEKTRAVKILSQKFSNANIDADTIEQCLYSIADNHSYLRGNRDPVDKMLFYLKKYFRPDQYEEGFSLAIQGGMGGARLTHSHTRQYHYVLQSMMLWREVLHDMFKLWYLAEEDLLDPENDYRLTDTGQGLNRVQQAPRIGRCIHKILANVQRSVEAWVGSSVVHLGDHNVPNALMFIDKYNQVSRILNPIVLCVDKVAEIYKDPEMRRYIDGKYGGVDNCRKTILADFFRHGFDGSGADNFFDAGSCIDGRLTSAWNWCAKVEKKAYFPIFLLTGFVGFDGQF
eukprot:TRINITY_DN2751_c0_g3_i1.p1 TRINITY_DN2751_c0_g3~~TRINITY_DN2751_c0_g3_i1.p1  ORF type:complete len:705 (+),score=190.15 TRINITY_DN2751_c0_g3_i1:161-2275(+)